MKKSMLIFFILIFSVSVKAEELPKVEAISAILMDYETGRVLWGRKINDPLPMASTTKIMTAIVTLENGNLNDTVKVSRRAATAPEVNMNLRAGEEIKLEYLLYALMLQSSNDAAIAIAEHISGSVEEFCKKMTERAKELGAVDTVFETPNGLDKGEHHSTSYDMALITRHALGMNEFMRIVNTPEVTAQSNLTTHTIVNKNRLLREYQGANGVKTGFTGKAGHCFIGSAKRDGVQLISVVLASGWGNKGKEQKWRDTKALLDYGFANYKHYVIVEKGKQAGSIPIERAKISQLAYFYEEPLELPLSQEEVSQVSVRVETPVTLLAPVRTNQTVGVAKVYLNEMLIKEINLVTNEGAKRHDFMTYFEMIIKEWTHMGRRNMNGPQE